MPLCLTHPLPRAIHSAGIPINAAHASALTTSTGAVYTQASVLHALTPLTSHVVFLSEDSGLFQVFEHLVTKPTA